MAAPLGQIRLPAALFLSEPAEEHAQDVVRDDGHLDQDHERDWVRKVSPHQGQATYIEPIHATAGCLPASAAPTTQPLSKDRRPGLAGVWRAEPGTACA